jgi:hypothetical protein
MPQEYTDFSLDDGIRIAKAVKIVEGLKAEEPLQIERSRPLGGGSQVKLAKAISVETWDSLPAWMTSRTNVWKMNLGTPTYNEFGVFSWTNGKYVDVWNLSNCYVTQNTYHEIWKQGGKWYMQPQANPDILSGNLQTELTSGGTASMYVFGSFTETISVVDYHTLILPSYKLVADYNHVIVEWDVRTLNYVLTDYRGCGEPIE